MTWSVYCWTQTDGHSSCVQLNLFGTIFYCCCYCCYCWKYKHAAYEWKTQTIFPIVANGHAHGKHHMFTPTNVCRHAWCMVQTEFSVNLTVFSRRRGKLCCEIVCQSFYFVAIVTILNGVLCVKDMETHQVTQRWTSKTKMNQKSKLKEKNGSNNNNNNKCIDDSNAINKTTKLWDTKIWWDVYIIAVLAELERDSVCDRWHGAHDILTEYQIHILYNTSVYY